MTRSLFGFSVLVLTVSVSSSVLGQEPINGADSATQPSPGHVILKEQFRYLSLDLDENRRDRRGDIDDAVFLTTLGVGLQADLSLSLRFPTVFRERELNDSNRTEREEGVGDVTGVLKWRVIRHDTSALDTFRLSLIGGAEVRTGDAPFTTDAYNPIFGLAFTKIAGATGSMAVSTTPSPRTATTNRSCPARARPTCFATTLRTSIACRPKSMPPTLTPPGTRCAK